MSTNKQKINNTNSFLQRKRSIKLKEVSDKPRMGTWDQSEDKKLRDWVKKNGAYNWTVCAEYMKNRTAKQCREHWKNTIDDNLIKGQWTAEEDLLIMKFYEKYESWRKMIPMFENRTENSIKNRFFSQLRKIVVKKRPPNGKKEYGTKYGLDTLKKYLNEGIEEAEKRYYEENKNMTKADFENYMIQIENSIKNRKKGKKFIDIIAIKNKNLNLKSHKSNNININEDDEDKKLIEDEDKEENLETYNNNNKPKKGRKKLAKNNIFKTTKNIEESITREETTNQKEIINFSKKISKSKIITNKSQEEEKKENEKLNNENNDNNIIIKKLSKKSEEDKKSNNFSLTPGLFNSYKINIPNNTNELQRSDSRDSLALFENGDNCKEKLRNHNKTSKNIENFKKGQNIITFISFTQQ